MAGPHHIGSALDLIFEAFKRIGGVYLSPVGLWESLVGQHVVLGARHQIGQLEGQWVGRSFLSPQASALRMKFSHQSAGWQHPALWWLRPLSLYVYPSPRGGDNQQLDAAKLAVGQRTQKNIKDTSASLDWMATPMCNR